MSAESFMKSENVPFFVSLNTIAQTFNLRHFILDQNVLKKYLYFEEHGYPPQSGLSTKNIQQFIEWADRNIQNCERVLLFKDLFLKAWCLFQETLLV